MSVTTRFAFALAAGLWIGVGGLALSGAVNPASAATTVSKQKAATATANEGRKRTASRIAAKSAANSAAKPAAAAAAATATGATAAAAGAAAVATPAPALSEVVANAHAQMAEPRSPEANAAPAAQSEPAFAEAEVVASDQLNELDRQASAQPPPQHGAAAVAQRAAGTGTLWDKTSLIGKIFIAFGALLTAASAARLAIA